MHALGERGGELLGIIVESFNRTGTAPTYYEMRDRMGLSSVTSIKFHLGALQRRGIIKIQPRKARGIEILKRPQEFTAEMAA